MLVDVLSILGLIFAVCLSHYWVAGEKYEKKLLSQRLYSFGIKLLIIKKIDELFLK
jgi:hypothetical protein